MYAVQQYGFVPLLTTMQEWLLIHRAHLHEALKAKAQASGKGQPAVLHTQCKVAGIDPHAATLTLEDGRIVQGNVVIGADGVHSVTRRQVPGGDVTIFSFGKNAFRFMVSRKEVLDDPETADMFRVHGTMDLWNSDDSRIIIYPCVNNEVLNFVCIHPDTLTNIGVTTGWKQSVGKSTLLDIYNSFSPTIQRVLDKADPETLKVWPLVDMETLPSWVMQLILSCHIVHQGVQWLSKMVFLLPLCYPEHSRERIFQND